MDTTKTLEILVIDDDALIRQTLKDVLPVIAINMGININVDTAADGEEGLIKYYERLERNLPYHAVITDLNMPKVTGVQVVSKLNGLREGNQPLVYVMTGSEATEEYKKLKEALGELSPDGVIGKPLNFAALRPALTEIAKRYSKI